MQSINMDDLARDMSLIHVETALKHAALASLASTSERCLGPDKSTLESDTETRFYHRKDLPNIASQLKESIKKISTEYIQPTTPKSSFPRLSTLKSSLAECERAEKCKLSVDTQPNFPDLSSFNSSIVKRQLAEKCKNGVRAQLNLLQQQRLQSASSGVERNAVDLIAELQQQRTNRLALKQQNDQLIQQQAEQMAMAELEVQQRELSSMRKKTELTLQNISFQGVARYQLKFRGKYESISKLLIALDKDSQKACGTINGQLRELVQAFDQLIGKIKASSCSPQELKTAEGLYKSLNELEQNLVKELKVMSQLAAEQLQQQKIDAANIAKQLEEEKQIALKAQQENQALEQKQQELEAQNEAAAAKAAVAATATTSAEMPATTCPTPITPPHLNEKAASTQEVPAQPETSISTSYVHPTRLAFYNEINQVYQIKVDCVKPLQTDETWKKYRTNCQRAINVPLNAITAVSSQHLTLNFEKLYNFFAGQPVKTIDGSLISINDHPLARDYCILLMAKKFVSQCETAISSNPQAAFPFASVIVTFWKLLPDFGIIFLAYIFKESPYLVPYIIPQQPSQTPEQYLKSIGYRLTERNELEKPDIYLKRQTGIARLYAAVIITPGRKADGPSHPYSLEEAWCWLIHMVQVKPLPDICATMIMEMLHTLGFELWRTYGRQFVKLLLFIQQYYLPQLTAYDEGGPKTRLEMLLAKFLRERQIPQAVGLLPLNFW